LLVAGAYGLGSFSLFFGSFDAVVLMASIYILFPKENQELAGHAMQHFHWTTQRFEAMQERNHLAKAARAVLQAIYVKFRKAVGNPPLPPTTCPATLPTPGSDGTTQSCEDSPSVSLTTMDTPASKATAGTTPASAAENGETTASSSSYPVPSATSEWTIPIDFDFTSIAPLYPMSDLIYNNLDSIPEDGGLPAWSAATPTADLGNNLWQFEGDFGTDSVWNVLNQYNPTYPQ
jgi:hypothetical protein